ncbi:MAG: hypothetical protein V2I43_14645 [Parvularcula sp.]|jgi:hypothetical protein|nr:hypothetical protein [Parvularcula sp.]
MKRLAPIVLASAAICATGFVAAPQAVSAQSLDTATQNQIRVKYINAKRAYDAKKYDEALSRLDEIESIAGGTRIATTQGLKVKTLVALKRWDAAREELAILYNLNPSAEVIEDVAPAADQVDRHFAAIAEKERKAAAERERQAKLTEERADKRQIMQDAANAMPELRFVTKGSNGKTGIFGRRSGRLGGHGGDGQPGSVGQNGRDIFLVIREVKTYEAAAPLGTVSQVDAAGQPIAYRTGSSGAPVTAVMYDFDRPLPIDTSGGRGGKGGDGADGTDGATGLGYRNSSPNGGDGGDGGRGGSGGTGGKGGNVTVSIYGSKAFHDGVRKALKINARGGAGGAGGKGGERGEGGGGRPKTDFFGNVTYGRDGRDGSNGRRGSGGSNGADGQVSIRHIEG